jgi:enterochelin esterase-like enzyme
MNRRRTDGLVLLLPLVVLAVQAAAAAQSTQPAEPKLDSPRLTALWQALEAGNTAALDGFYQEIKGKAPLVEPIPGDGHNLRVTFVRRAGAIVRSIFLDGGLPGHPVDKQLARLGGTDLWFRTERIPNDARFYYGFGVLSGSATQPNSVGDPFNPRGAVELPGAPPWPWIQPLPNVPAGKLTNQRLTSQILNGATRTFTVYTPASYDPSGNPYGLLILFDGETYQDRNAMAAPIVLDNLIAKQQIQPLIAVLVNTQNSSTRERDLANSPSFADFLTEELVPWVRQNYHISTDPRRAIVGGKSLGGLMAAYCGLRHPEVFGTVLSQSGSYWVWEGWPNVSPRSLGTESGWLTRRFATTQPLPLRFFLSVGRLEVFPGAYGEVVIDQTLENRRLRDVLEAKGYPVVYREVNSDHSPLNYRTTFADGLIALAGPPKP